MFENIKRNKIESGIIVAIFIIATALFGEKINSNETFAYGESVVVRYLDVGQADSILVQSEGINMLIDAGTNSSGQTVVKDLEDLGVTKIDYLIGTHPHEDHIGGMDDIIKNFDIGIIYMPKIQTNTKTFEDVLDAVSEKGLKITSPKKGDEFEVGGARCEIMTDRIEDTSNLNLSSIVIRMTYGTQSFLFMGDAEKENEETRQWPQTTVLKVGHHGSSTSSSTQFLNEVQPQISVISVGKDNKYGHPTKTTINKLEKIKTKIYRTDESGTITITSDGKKCIVTTEK